MLNLLITGMGEMAALYLRKLTATTPLPPATSAKLDKR
jgi:hypothetical protein